MTAAPSVLVVTVVHHPDDARIRYREIEALLDAGMTVTYAAPFSAYGVQPAPRDGLTTVDLPRAVGRRRLAALRAARGTLRRLGPAHGAVLLHDPELLLAVSGVPRDRVVWDVHEDTAAAIEVKAWLPAPLRRPAAAAVRLVERMAERAHPLLLAEHGYADRFARPHVVVPNTTTVPVSVPPAGTDRVVYLGSVTVARGARVLADLGRILTERTGGAVSVEIVGPPRDEETRELLEAARDAGHLTLHGFVPNAEALTLVEGSLAGLSLLRDEANYRHSAPTKIYEYLARGVPVVSTPLPVAREIVEASGAGVLVPFDDAQAAADAVLALRADPERARTLGSTGHAYALAHHDWTTQRDGFVAEVRRVVAAGEKTPAPPR